MEPSRACELSRDIEKRLERWAKNGNCATEYATLKHRGPIKPTVVSHLNRFGGHMGPYQDSLLHLTSVEYINASPIDTLGNGLPDVVATMCPKRDTFQHFWAMCWELRTATVVNLTHAVDAVGSGDADKRERYWPPFEPALAREARTWPVRVATLGCATCATVPGLRRYTIELSASGEVRRLHLYWYSQWTDFPASSSIGSRQYYDNAWNVLRVAVHLDRKLRAGEPAEQWPVCHCSAGVGRTGTLLALLTTLRALPVLSDASALDAFIKRTIESMRQRRLWMVKTDAEYALIYAAVLQYVTRRPEDDGAADPYELEWRASDDDPVDMGRGDAARAAQDVRAYDGARR